MAAKKSSGSDRSWSMMLGAGATASVDRRASIMGRLPGMSGVSGVFAAGAVMQAVLLWSGAAAGQTAVRAISISPAGAASIDLTNDEGDGEPGAAPPEMGAEPGGEPAAAGGATLPKDEITQLKGVYDELSPSEREEMKAAYAGMGVDLDVEFASLGPAGGPTPLVMAVQGMDFARDPRAVLAARSQLGFGQVPRPDSRTAPPAAMAKWLRLHVMAGEWETFAKFLAERPPAEGEAIYSHVLQSMNKGDPGLLPEEVLAIALAAPGEMKDWQLESLSRLLQTSASKYSTGPLLAQIRAGTRLMGGTDAQTRGRAVTFLAGAGLVQEAYEYLPSLEEAREKGDAAVIVNHGRYNLDLMNNARGPEADGYRMTAWNLFCEASMLADAPFAVKQDAMRRAIDLLPSVPPSAAKAWFTQVFANPTLGPAALEIVAVKAMTIRDAKLDVEQRAQTILTMKDAVDTLLTNDDVDVRTLRIPLRMLTTALVGEAEAATKEKGRERVVARETELLLRALPGEKWLDAIEPSLAARASRASIAIATIADKTDLAIEMLQSALKRSPDQAVDLADSFLQNWENRLNPKSNPDQDQMYFYWGYRDQTPAAPITRGRQRRNLDRLKKLVAVLQGMGVESRQLPSVTMVFKACYSKTEVFALEDVAKVFGPIGQMPGATAQSLAESMRQSLGGDWRSRDAQRDAGMNRTASEIADLVDKGYGTAIELADRALAAEPDSWSAAIVKASLSYDRMQFKQANKKQDFAKYDEYRRDAFLAFQKAAEQYAKGVAKGEQRDNASVYQAWFASAISEEELNYLNRDDAPKGSTQGDTGEDQIDLIRKSILMLPKDAADRHMSIFARAVEGQVNGAPPEVKPRLVKQVLRIVGDHPAGASLRALGELYQDLVKDEIKLRLTVDGSDRVGVNKSFGLLLSLRFTTAVDRETGGFSKYLQNDVYGRVGNQYRAINYRDLLKKAIEESLRKDFEVETVGFFESLTPSRMVTENGEDGWMEKPMAYIVLKRKDASVDRVPSVSMDMYFNDPTGSVTLSLPSNAPPLDTSAEGSVRPVKNLTTVQIVDLRRLQADEKDLAVTLEVRAKGRGVIPDLRELLSGVDGALDGYSIEEKGIEARPLLVQQDEESSSMRFFWGRDPEPPKGGYAEADENGIYRLMMERSWVVTFTRNSGTIGAAFDLPTLEKSTPGTLVSMQYADMDVLPVTESTIAVHPKVLTTMRLMVGAVALMALGAGGFALYRYGRRDDDAADESLHLPTKITPLTVVTTLRRFQSEHGDSLSAARGQELSGEITALERRYFADDAPDSGPELKAALDRWTAAIQGR